MRAGLRFTIMLAAAGLGLGPASALAQSTTEPPPTSNTPATDAVGPRELQNFSLPGTTTRPADQPAQAPAAPGRAETPPAATAPATADQPEVRRPAARSPASQAAPAQTRQAPPAAKTPPPVADSPTLSSPTQPSLAPAPQFPSSPAAVASSAPPPPALAPEPERKFSFLPWLLAAFALAAGTGLLLWRRRPREALAGGPQIDLFAVPEPAPRPRPMPRPAPPAAAPSSQPLPPQPVARPSGGIVASRLRPTLEIGMQPLRCVVADDQVTLEFEIDLYNAGTAPARAVLAEASMLNAGGTQEQELSAFFANPVGAGQRIDSIPPLKRVTMTSQVVAPRAAIQEYDLAGRKAFVPVIAFNALYEWSGGQAQTSAAYLVGRETGHDKLGPMHLDQGAREFRAVGARPLPTVLRT